MSFLSPRRLVLAGVLLGTATVHAQPAPPAPAKDDTSKESPSIAEARKLFLEGNEHYSAGRYQLAAEAFLKAYNLSGKPALLFNLANTYERAGNYEKAAQYLRLYLDSSDVHDPDAVKARLQRLELAVIEQQKKKTDAPAPTTTPVAPTPPPERTGPSHVPYYLVGGGVVLGAAAAVTFGMLTRNERSDIRGLCMEQDGGELCPPQAASHLSNEKTYSLISDVGLGLAGAAVVTGVIYYAATRHSGSDERSHQTVSVVPSASVDSVGVVAVGRF